jgi:hypothetical protein
MENIDQIAPEPEEKPKNFVLDVFSDEIPFEWLVEAAALSLKKARRSAKFDKISCISFVLLMGLFRRTSYVNLRDIFFPDQFEDEPLNTTSITGARDRLGCDPIRFLFEKHLRASLENTKGFSIGPFRAKALDGTTLTIPDSEENGQYFGYPKNQKGTSAYPKVRIVYLADLGTRVAQACNFGPYTAGELTLAKELINRLTPLDLVFGDRLYYSKELAAAILAQGAQFVLRVRKDLIFKRIRILGPGDELVRVEFDERDRRENPDLPEYMDFRLLTQKPRNGKEPLRILTTLLDHQKYSKEFLCKMYFERWGIETALKEIKRYLLKASTITEPCHLRSMTPDRIAQEMYGVMLAYNITRAKMAKAAERQNRDPRRLSFNYCFAKIRALVAQAPSLRRGNHPSARRAFSESLCRVEIPSRPGRHYRREVKVQSSPYPVKAKRIRA